MSFISAVPRTSPDEEHIGWRHMLVIYWEDGDINSVTEVDADHFDVRVLDVTEMTAAQLSGALESLGTWERWFDGEPPPSTPPSVWDDDDDTDGIPF